MNSEDSFTNLRNKNLDVIYQTQKVKDLSGSNSVINYKSI